METKKVKIRVAVIVDSNGDWGAAGWSHAKNLDCCFDECAEGISNDTGTVGEKWIMEAEIDVPVQSVRTIESTITKQEKD